MTEETKSSTKYVMVESSLSADEDDIDLLELIRTLLHAWKTIIGMTVACVGLAVAYALSTPNLYQAQTLLASASDNELGVSSAIGQLGGLATIAGVSIPSNTEFERVIATLKTREFLKEFIKDKNLLPKIFSDYWDEASKSWILLENQTEFSSEDGVGVLQGAVEVDVNDKSRLITLSVTWNDSEFVAKLANDLVKQLNEQLREQAIADSQKRVGYLEHELSKTTLQEMRTVLYNLLKSEKQRSMLANVKEDFALEIIDPAITPKSPVKPNRKLIVALGGVCGGFFGIFFVLLSQFLQRLKTNKSSSK